MFCWWLGSMNSTDVIAECFYLSFLGLKFNGAIR